MEHCSEVSLQHVLSSLENLSPQKSSAVGVFFFFLDNIMGNLAVKYVLKSFNQFCQQAYLGIS